MKGVDVGVIVGVGVTVEVCVLVDVSVGVNVKVGSTVAVATSGGEIASVFSETVDKGLTGTVLLPQLVNNPLLKTNIRVPMASIFLSVFTRSSCKALSNTLYGRPFCSVFL